jgi:hypothetical protein
MPIRTASLTRKISANGQALHRAMMSRGEAGADKAPSEAESALIEERRLLKEERIKRKEEALQPKPKAIDKLVRTHRPEARDKDKPKAKGESHDASVTKKPKAHKTRAEKHAEKAAALEAARRSPKKPAK